MHSYSEREVLCTECGGAFARVRVPHLSGQFCDKACADRHEFRVLYNGMACGCGKDKPIHLGATCPRPR